jgi:sensor histidine kinase YesM
MAVRMVGKHEPFLAREAFWALTLVPPAITLLIAQGGPDPPEPGRAAGCLLATWLCTIVLGFALHTVTNWTARLLGADVAPRLPALALMTGAGAATVVVGLLVLLPRLAFIDPNLARPLGPFIARGLAIATLYVVAARLYTTMAERNRRAAERARSSEDLALRARLAALQAQVNPHFLFNTLNAVASLIPGEPALAESTVERLAGVLQYAIGSGDRARVTVGEEVAAVRDYLEIEHARFGARISSRIEVAPELEQHPIPPMLLQPLVENALLHGLAQRADTCTSPPSARGDDESVVLMVADNGVGLGRSARPGNQTALKNLRERIALIYGGAARLEVRDRAGGGCECELRLPRAARP